MSAPDLSGRPPRPSPVLSVDQVVAAQLAALRTEARRGVGAGEGIQAAWAFASPENQAATGPLARFAAMLRGPVYGGLLSHRAAHLGPVHQRGDDARQEVLVLTDDDAAQGFTWVLGRRREGAHAGCWLTDGVLRHAEPEWRGA